MKGLSLASIAVVALLGASSAALAGPTGRYYVTDESGFNRIWQFQGNTLSSFPTTTQGADGPIVVDGNTNTVRSVAGGFSGGQSSSGSEYNFAGGVVGGLTLNALAFPGYGRIIDAAFDGTNAYVVAGLFGNAGVFKYNADFSGPGQLVFNIAGAAQATAQGITYDTTTNTIWTSDYDFNATQTGGRVRQWSLTGVELSSFAVVDNQGNASERNTALAYDFTDDTFWLNAHVETTLGFGFGELWQFDRNGNFLQKIHGAQLASNAPQGILYWGGEIRATGAPAEVPEPASFGLLGAALIGLAALRRRG